MAASEGGRARWARPPALSGEQRVGAAGGGLRVTSGWGGVRPGECGPACFGAPMQRGQVVLAGPWPGEAGQVGAGSGASAAHGITSGRSRVEAAWQRAGEGAGNPAVQPRLRIGNVHECPPFRRLQNIPPGTWPIHRPVRGRSLACWMTALGWKRGCQEPGIPRQAMAEGLRIRPSPPRCRPARYCPRCAVHAARRPAGAGRPVAA